MTLSTEGTLGDISVAERALREDIPAAIDSLPEKARNAYLDIEAYRRVNPSVSVEKAAEATGHSWQTYYNARRKVVACTKEAMEAPRKGDMIRPGDKIVETVLEKSEVFNLPAGWTVDFSKFEPKAKNPEPVEESQPTEKDVLYRVIAELETLADDNVRQRILRTVRVFLGIDL